MGLTIGEMCAGYGGLTMGVRQHCPDAVVSWYAETDEHAVRVMAYHHQQATNLGDITAPPGAGRLGLPRRHLVAPRRARQAEKRRRRRMDAWSTVSPVDVLTAGFPCQPFSAAGRRAGVADERHLWPVGVLPAVTTLRPPVVLLENVDGLRTIDGGRVFATILSDLDALGYTVRWTTIGACRIGLCHHRHRLFVLATLTPGDLPYELGMPIRAWSALPRDGACSSGLLWSHPSDVCGGERTRLPTPNGRDGNLRASVPGRSAAARKLRRGRADLEDAVALLPTPTCSDGTAGPGRRPGTGSLPLRDVVTTLLPTPRASDGVKGGPNQRGSSGDLALPAAVQPERWGRYAAAVAEHAAVVGRRPPTCPTVVGRRGSRRVNPELTEWMMGLPSGHLTGVVDDANACNKLAGNGVVPVVGAMAVRILLDRAGFPTMPGR